MSPAEGRRNVRLIYAFAFLRDFQLWIPVWVVYLIHEHGFSLTQITVADSLFLVGVLLLEVPTGAVADRWGRSRSLALGALSLGIAVLVFAFTSSFAVLLVSFLIWSLSHTLMSGADMALLYDTLKASGASGTYERAAGRANALNWLGAGLGTLLGGPAAVLFDIRATIFIGAATCLLTAMVALLLREAPRSAEDSPEAHFAKAIRAAFREAWSARDVRTVILFAGTTISIFEGVHYLVQPYLLDRGVEVGVIFSLLQVPMILAGVLGALAADRLGAGKGLSAVLFGIAMAGFAGYLALAWAPGLAAFAGFPALIGLASCLMPLSTGYVNRRVGSTYRATILSLQGMMASLALAVLAPVLGFATDHWGLPWAFAIGAGLAVAAGLAVGGLPPKPAPATEQSPRSAPADA
jgi:MFS family permease